MARFLDKFKAQNRAALSRSVDDSAFMKEYLAQRRRNHSAPSVSGNTPKSSFPVGQINIPLGNAVFPTQGSMGQKWHNPNRRYASGHHTGIDIMAKSGTQIRAAKGGVVTFSGWNNAYGNMVKIRHKDGTTSLYAHMLNPGIKAGSKVMAGTSIGNVGSTGHSDGAHLHFEVRKVDKYGSDIDPVAWLSN